jgi:6-pyruvoyltetrahydropterin/6-carboxytetrahydropterin synthase
MFELSQTFYFEAAHTLQRQHEAEGSRRVHGHTYHAEVQLTGKPDPSSGMVMDLAVLRAAIARVREQLDHHLLDDVAGLGPATLENLCVFIHREVARTVPGVSQVSVSRATGDRCAYRP